MSQEQAVRLDQRFLESIGIPTPVNKILHQLFDSSPTTASHSIRTLRMFPFIVQLMLPPSSVLPAETINDLGIAALLHDIGKLPVADLIESRVPVGPFEIAEIHRHPLFSERILSPFFISNHMAMQVALYHHERYDGKGYPHGIKREGIPWLARVFTVVDQFDAATHQRTYNKHYDAPEKALDDICKEAGKKFDPKVVEIFAANFDRIRQVMRLTDLDGSNNFRAPPINQPLFLIR